MGSFKDVLGLELKLIDEGHYVCKMTLLVKDKQTVQIKLKKIVEGSISEVIAAIPKQYPIAAVFTGRGLIQKNLQVEQPVSTEQLFQNAFPAINRNDFYLQDFSDGNFFLLGIARKKMVDELLDKFDRAGLNILWLAFGGIVTYPVWSQINSYGEELRFDGHAFKRGDQNRFLSYHQELAAHAEFATKVGEEEIDEQLLLAYAVGFQLILHQQIEPISADVIKVSKSIEQQLGNLKLKQMGTVFLGVIFFLLLGNFLLFTNYNAQNDVLSRVVGEKTAGVGQLDLLKNNIAQNELLLKQLNWNGGYNYGFLIDQIGASMPRRLKLEKMLMNRFVSEEEKLERIPKIEIIGTTDNLTAANNWVYLLKVKKWVKTVRLVSYRETQEEMVYQFGIVITY